MTKKIKKRSFKIGGAKTSVTLEDSFWDGLKEIAGERGVSLNQLVNDLSPGPANAANFSSSIREFVLEHYRTLVRDALANHQAAP